MRPTHPFVKGLRTFAQVSFVEAVLQFLAAFHWVVLAPDQHVATLALVTPLVAYLQNLFEERSASKRA